MKGYLEIVIRFWFNFREKVFVHYLKSTFLGYPTGAQLAEAILTALDGDKLPLENMKMSSSDGLHVAKSV